VIDGLEMESPHEFYSTAIPKISSLNSFRWDEDPSYVTIAASMGYDLSVNGEKESFYNNVTLEDLFSDEDSFFELIDDSVDNMDTSLNNFFTDYPDFVTSISKYAPDDTNHENSFYSTLDDIVKDATNNATLSSENTKMVQYLDRLSFIIREQYLQNQAYQVLISHRSGFDYSELKPNQELKVYLNRFFGESITKWEIN
jgi:hypothetical protein